MTTIIDILGYAPNGALEYTVGNGSADPGNAMNLLFEPMGSIAEITEIDDDRIAEIRGRLAYYDPSAKLGDPGDYRLFDITDYPDINVDQVCQHFVVVWP